ncbi:ABC transporter ATP-binding protein [Weissella diestrammenae]|uniref:ABC transporter ATP-binding protein n=1 Tax=Weissella diestrammenae TaxID=1162633 RepID=A0A7G9T4A7_9LACO|nr:ABC transporter ATP-binding protein [Weissella diestrammenae]MCM0583464.1 ABC transporter ATP-binding protein [Weissella diestrammenae]QNN74932.1 ABC transporter ATP-binding protein [Weissella diestrammenae]
MNFIQACLGDYDTFIFDEPTSGVDVESAVIMMKIIKEIKSRGAAILLTSHNIEELQEASDYIYFINQGVIEQAGTVKEILSYSRHDATVEYVLVPQSIEKMAAYLDESAENDYYIHENVIVMAFSNINAMNCFLKSLVFNNIILIEIYQSNKKLKDVLFAAD